MTVPKGPRRTLAQIRASGGALAVRAAIEIALGICGNATDAAAFLGTRPGALRRAAARVGAPWPVLPPGPDTEKRRAKRLDIQPV